MAIFLEMSASRRTPVAKELLRSSGQFDSESVRRGDLSSSGLVSLSGVEAFTGLSALNLDDNKVSAECTNQHGANCTEVLHS